MSTDDAQIQINTTRDKLNFALPAFALGAAALSATSLALASQPFLPKIFTTLLLVSYLNHWRRLQKLSIPQRVTNTNDLPENAKHLPKNMQWMSQKLGMESTPQLYIIRNDDNQSSEDKRRTLKGMCAYAGTSHIEFTEDLATGLSKDENTAIAAHEVAHIAANHASEMHLLRNETIISSGAFIVTKIASLGFGASPQEVLAAWGLAATVITGAMFLERQYFRSAEFQADRISGELTSQNDLAFALLELKKQDTNQSPLGVMKSLRLNVFDEMIDAVSKRAFIKAARILFSMPDVAADQLPHFATHPPIERRVKNLLTTHSLRNSK